MSHHNVQNCKSEQECHSKNHLCKLVVKGDMDRVKKLVKDAKYYCKKCGRAALDKENLCSPSSI